MYRNLRSNKDLQRYSCQIYDTYPSLNRLTAKEKEKLQKKLKEQLILKKPTVRLERMTIKTLAKTIRKDVKKLLNLPEFIDVKDGEDIIKLTEAEVDDLTLATKSNLLPRQDKQRVPNNRTTENVLIPNCTRSDNSFRFKISMPDILNQMEPSLNFSVELNSADIINQCINFRFDNMKKERANSEININKKRKRQTKVETQTTKDANGFVNKSNIGDYYNTDTTSLQCLGKRQTGSIVKIPKKRKADTTIEMHDGSNLLEQLSPTNVFNINNNIDNNYDPGIISSQSSNKQLRSIYGEADISNSELRNFYQNFTSSADSNINQQVLDSELVLNNNLQITPNVYLTSEDFADAIFLENSEVSVFNNSSSGYVNINHPEENVNQDDNFSNDIVLIPQKEIEQYNSINYVNFADNINANTNISTSYANDLSDTTNFPYLPLLDMPLLTSPNHESPTNSNNTTGTTDNFVKNKSDKPIIQKVIIYNNNSNAINPDCIIPDNKDKRGTDLIPDTEVQNVPANEVQTSNAITPLLNQQGLSNDIENHCQELPMLCDDQIDVVTSITKDLININEPVRQTHSLYASDMETDDDSWSNMWEQNVMFNRKESTTISNLENDYQDFESSLQKTIGVEKKDANENLLKDDVDDNQSCCNSYSQLKYTVNNNDLLLDKNIPKNVFDISTSKKVKNVEKGKNANPKNEEKIENDNDSEDDILSLSTSFDFDSDNDEVEDVKKTDHLNSIEPETNHDQDNERMASFQDIFGISCCGFLVKRCNYQASCVYSHEFNSADFVRQKIKLLSLPDLNLIYNYVYNHKLLYECYFGLFCEEYCTRNNIAKLYNIIGDCSRQTEYKAEYLMQVYKCLLQCGHNMEEACYDILNYNRNKSNSFIKVLSEIVIKSDWNRFCEYVRNLLDHSLCSPKIVEMLVRIVLHTKGPLPFKNIIFHLVQKLPPIELARNEYLQNALPLLM